MFRVGFTFAGLIWLSSLSGCCESKPESYPVLDAPMPPPISDGANSATIIVEMIEVDGVEFSDWQLSNTLEPTRATPLRKAVQTWLRSRKGRLIETMIVNAKDFSRSEVKSVREVIYPTEYRYPVMTKTETVTDPNDRNKSTKTTTEETVRGVAATGRVFTTREAGSVLEVDCQIDPESRVVKIELAAELSHHLENLEWQATSGDDVEKFDAPSFDKNSFQTSLTLQHGVYGLIGSGTMPESLQSDKFTNPTLLVFVRADLNQPNP